MVSSSRLPWLARSEPAYRPDVAVNQPMWLRRLRKALRIIGRGERACFRSCVAVVGRLESVATRCGEPVI
jgi:hypothetical protein